MAERVAKTLRWSDEARRPDQPHDPEQSLHAVCSCAAITSWEHLLSSAFNQDEYGAQTEVLRMISGAWKMLLRRLGAIHGILSSIPPTCWMIRCACAAAECLRFCGPDHRRRRVC